MPAFDKLNIFRKLAEHQHITVEAFGPSNTQRRLPGMTWFDFVELGFKSKYGGGCGNFINTGIGGNTTAMMLARFDRDVRIYKPDVVIVTAGGNDANPVHKVSPEQYRANMLEIHRRITELGAEVIFQTYYACRLELIPPERAELMNILMQIVREVAAETGSLLQDNYRRWNRLRDRFPEVYALLMKDAMHVTPDGNAVIGLGLLRSFGIELSESFAREFTSGYLGMTLLDLLEQA
ncbi:MAG: SGNH/GDSL hydrolase family protein [Lentisphaeria bacterium]|nr:SGNH/GDSL hydrolase family protein [Lentisphaeria bacterium]